jgi:hypothetical protein
MYISIETGKEKQFRNSSAIKRPIVPRITPQSKGPTSLGRLYPMWIPRVTKSIRSGM